MPSKDHRIVVRSDSEGAKGIEEYVCGWEEANKALMLILIVLWECERGSEKGCLLVLKSLFVVSRIERYIPLCDEIVSLGI